MHLCELLQKIKKLWEKNEDIILCFLTLSDVTGTK